MKSQISTNQMIELAPGGGIFVRDASGVRRSLEASALVRLAGQREGSDLDPTVRFWQSLAERFLQTLCQVPEGAALKLDAPSNSALREFRLHVPPMRGGEYLTTGVLRSVWSACEVWTRARIDACGGVRAFLEAEAPRWTRIGRVTLHLAENKSDPEFPFAFMASYAAGLSDSGRMKQLPLGKALKEYAGEGNRPMLLQLLKPLRDAAKRSALLADLIETGDVFHPLIWTPGEAFAFLQEASLYEESKLAVSLPNWWKKRTSRPQVAVTVGEEPKSSVGIRALLDFHLAVVVNGQRLTRAEITKLLEGEDGLVILRGQWVEVDREKLRQALAHWKRIEAHGGISFAEGMRMLAGAPARFQAQAAVEPAREWAFTQPGEWMSDVLGKLRDPEQLAPPAALQATLRPYQEVGLNWLWFCMNMGLGACLADDMGLGKTIQVLALLLRKKESDPQSGPAILVVPASLIGNWKREAHKFGPSLRLFIAHRSESSDIQQPRLESIDLVITTYGMLHRLRWLTEVSWSWAILDEAQAIKNHATRQSRSVRALEAEARIALTGTPIENKLADLWSLFDFLNPGLLGNSTQFAAYVSAMAADEQEGYAPLRRLVSPYILRRLKTDKALLPDLPDKTQICVYCGLSTAQASLYQKTIQELLAGLKEAEGPERKGLVLTHLMRLKQICNHPAQATGQGDYDSAQSAKFQQLEARCAEMASRGEKVLVFTQFKEMTEPLADCLAGVFGRPGLVLHGGTPVKKRQQLVEEFQSDDGPPFFVLSIKAGGTGLNLTAASHVVHFDRWWNPAVENQATDRAFRIGQKKNVMVHTFITTGTLEEKIHALLEDKQRTADDLLSGAAVPRFTEMGDEELIELLGLNLEQTEMVE